MRSVATISRRSAVFVDVADFAAGAQLQPGDVGFKTARCLGHVRIWKPIPIILSGIRMLLSILIPVYNERTVVERSLALVLAAPLPENMDRELVIVDDCSTDGTSDILKRLAEPANRASACSATR